MANNIRLTAFRNMVEKAKNCRRFLKENILTDITRQNRSVFDNEGVNNYGDGQKWIPNSPHWTRFKEDHIGKIARAYGQKFMIKYSKCEQLTGRMYKALTRNSPSQDIQHKITNNKLEYIANIPYLPLQESGYGKVPPRKILFAGKEQVKSWANMLQRYLMP